MDSRKKRRKRQKRIRSAIRATFCALVLVLMVGIIHLLTNAAVKLLPSTISEDAPINPPDDTSNVPEEKNEQKEQNSDKGQLTVCIDAGHGGKDAGSDNGTRLEKNDTLALALAIADYLKKNAPDINVVLTRSDDTYLTLSQRCTVANEANADCFVSVHRNKGNGTGVETWIYSEADQKTKDLAGNIMSGLDSAGIQKNRGVKYGTQKSSSQNYYINSHSDMPSCIVELGFIDNDKDNTLFDEKQTAYAEAIGSAIIKTCSTYQPESNTPANADANASDNKTENDNAENDNTENNNAENNNTTSNTLLEKFKSNIQSTSTSHTLDNPQIDNVASLDNTNQDWGPGADVDEQNRPHSALSYQEKYGKYNANFIVPDDNKIYLSFDEGYENGCTPAILDTLKEKNVSVVFFVTAQFAKDEPELVQRIIDEGHMLGSHSVSHPANGLPSQSIEEQQHEVMGLHDYIKENFNYEMHLFRFPAGKFSDQSLAIVNNCNYKSVFWSFAYLDYDVNNQPDPAEALSKLTDRLHPGAIYLLHAVSSTNTEVLGSFIDNARAAGYEFGLFD